jgi:hypothetical protein
MFKIFPFFGFFCTKIGNYTKKWDFANYFQNYVSFNSQRVSKKILQTLEIGFPCESRGIAYLFEIVLNEIRK